MPCLLHRDRVRISLSPRNNKYSIRKIIKPVYNFEDQWMATTDIEKENLEAHVELCAERYKQLELRLSTIEVKVENLAEKIEDSQSSMSKVIIGATATIVAGLLSTVITILMKF